MSRKLKCAERIASASVNHTSKIKDPFNVCLAQPKDSTAGVVVSAMHLPVIMAFAGDVLWIAMEIACKYVKTDRHWTLFSVKPAQSVSSIVL